MKTLLNGRQIDNTMGVRVGDLFFDSGHLYISQGNLPICIKNVDSALVKQLGHFFYFYGKDFHNAATRIDFSNRLSVRIDGTIIYFINGKNCIQFNDVVPTEIKKLGMWLKNYE